MSKIKSRLSKSEMLIRLSIIQSILTLAVSAVIWGLCFATFVLTIMEKWSVAFTLLSIVIAVYIICAIGYCIITYLKHKIEKSASSLIE